MLKSLILPAIIIITLIAAIPSVAFTSESYSIRLSCTIPEIPGVNAPLINDNTSTKNTQTPATEGKQLSNSATIFENNKEETRLVKGETKIVALKTVYSR